MLIANIMGTQGVDQVSREQSGKAADSLCQEALDSCDIKENI
jgi:hypothetical protein